MATTLYPLIDQAASVGASTLPAGFLGTWDFTSPLAGASAALLSQSSEASQVTESSAFSTVPSGTSKRFGLGQFLSPLLTAQTVGAATWTIGIGALSTGSNSATKQWRGELTILLVNGATGAIRTTVFTIGFLGILRNTTTEVTAYSAAISCGAFTATAGDYLAVELGVSQSNSSGSNFSTTCELFTSGATAISSDNAATSDAQSFVTCPSTLTFQTVTVPPPYISCPIGAMAW